TMGGSPAKPASPCRPRRDSMVAPFQADFTTLPAQDRYKLLCALVVPRPIALVTTLGPGGIVNAAPFSFFNVFAEAPPLIVLGLQSRPDGSLKDTSAHIRDIGSFTVNLTDEALAERMNVCAVDSPPRHERDRCRRSDGAARRFDPGAARGGGFPGVSPLSDAAGQP